MSGFVYFRFLPLWQLIGDLAARHQEMNFLPVGMQLDPKRPLHTAPVIHVGPGEPHVMRNPSSGTVAGSGLMGRSTIRIYAEAQCLVHFAVTLAVTLVGSLTSLGLHALLEK